MTKEVTLVCLLWPDAVNEAVSITIDVQRNTYQLKGALFRGPYGARLVSGNIIKLKLWKCAIPVDVNCRATLNTLRFDGADDRLQSLQPVMRAVNYFKEGEVQIVSTSSSKYRTLVSIRIASSCLYNDET